jgi:solute carrier family 25 oxoglutarate transporter 11
VSDAKEFVIGGLSGMSASAVTHPIDLIKVRMLLHGELQSNQRAKLSIVWQVVQREGIRGLYSGLSAALVRQSLYST